MSRTLLQTAFALTVLFPIGAHAQTETEPNNTSGTANTLTYNTPMTGKMGVCVPTDNSTDYFILTTTTQGVMRVQSTMSNTGLTDLEVTFQLRTSGTSVLGTFTLTAGANGVPVNDQYDFTCQGVGTYYISLVNPSTTVCTNYTFSYSYIAPVYSNDPEPNNGSGTATVLAAGVQQNGQINFQYGDNSDYYRITLPSNGVLNVAWQAEHAGAAPGTLTLTLRNNGTGVIQTWTVGVGANSVPVSETVSMTCRGNTNDYFLSLASNVCGTSYRFNYTVTPPAFAIAPPTTASTSTATTVDLGSGPVEGQINFYQGPTTVFYRFVVTATTPMTMSFLAEHAGPDPAAYRVQLLNSLSATLGTIVLQAGGNSTPLAGEADFGSRPAGTYYVSVDNSPCGMSFRIFCLDDDDDGTCNAVDLCPGGPEPGTPCDDGNAGTINDVITGGCICAGTPIVHLSAKAFLEGPYNNGVGLMNDALRSLGAFPLTDPYPGLGYTHTGTGNSGSVAPAVLAVTGNGAIVDWVLLELRSTATPTSIVASRSCLLQRDGDIVELDGISPVSFFVAPNSYMVAVRQRNHLGAMTANPVALASAPITVDFTTATTVTYGTQARKSIAGTFPAEVLWAGDVSFNAAIKYTGTGNDRDPILVAVGSTTPNNVVSNTYNARDVNMNGEVKYTGSGNDRDPILVNVGSTTPNNVRTQQLP
jgi:hypothetical protein